MAYTSNGIIRQIHKVICSCNPQKLASLVYLCAYSAAMHRAACRGIGSGSIAPKRRMYLS